MGQRCLLDFDSENMNHIEWNENEVNIDWIPVAHMHAGEELNRFLSPVIHLCWNMEQTGVFADVPKTNICRHASWALWQPSWVLHCANVQVDWSW
jgi:hypothetical protein